MTPSKIDFFTYTINGDTWNIYKISENDNVTLDGPESEAEIDFNNLEIHFKRTNYKSVKHECWHLFKHYTYTNSANLEAVQEEEVSAELFAHLSEKMEMVAKEIYAKLKALSND